MSDHVDLFGGPADPCPVCGQVVVDECDICALAEHRGFSIEEARLEVEDNARFWSRSLGRAEGKRCSCGTVDAARIPGFRGRGYVTYLDFDSTHKVGCPLAPPAFDWPEVDEDARERAFGYRGREHHAARLAAALREIKTDREVWGE